MNYENVKKIIDGIVENEISHIVMEKEEDFIIKNTDYIKQSEKTKGIYDTLKNQLTEEQQYLLNNLIDSVGLELILLNEFYFKEGLRAGLSNLKFLNEINNSAIIL
ncbi:hypothetical protein ABFP60_14700 [Clostridioides difficile]